MKPLCILPLLFAASCLKPTPPPDPGVGYDCAAQPTFPRGKVVTVANALANRYIVVRKPGASIQPLVSVAGVEVTHTLKQGYAAKIAAQALAKILADPSVAYVQEDGEKHVSPKPAAAASIPWGLDRIDQRDWLLDGKYEPMGDGAGVNVAIIDTGVTSHPDFASRLQADCFTAHSGGCADGHGHGTHVAGTAAGTKYGVAKAATLYAVRVLDASGSGSDSDVIRGIEWVAAKKRANPSQEWVANMSLGGGAAPALDQAVCDALAVGVDFAIAAGNEDADASSSSPARVVQAVTVGATDRGDRRAYFSNYGSLLDTFAPGVDVLSATPQGGETTMSGTSMASPHVAGVLALIHGNEAGLTPAQAAERLLAKATVDVVTDPKGSANRLPFVGKE